MTNIERKSQNKNDQIIGIVQIKQVNNINLKESGIMKLLTKEIEKELEKYPIGSQDDLGEDAKVIVKYFNPCGAGTWLVTEAEKQADGDWLLFGYACITDWEWGYTLLSELENIALPYGMKIERDLYSSGTVKELV